MAGLALGWVYGVLQESQEMGAAYLAIFVASTLVLGAAGVALSDDGPSGIRSAIRAVPVLIATFLGLALGDFSTFLLGIDGRTLAEYGDSRSMSWEKALVVTVALSVMYGALIGLAAAFMAHVFRAALTRRSQSA
jgi:hypothetical protein